MTHQNNTKHRYARIVVKVGTKVLTAEDGTIDHEIIQHLVAQLADAKKQGIEVVLVTSGAVGTGRSLLGVSPTENTPAVKQVCAAVGQVKLMSMYGSYFEQHNLLSAQVLATKEDFRDRTHYHNMRICFQNLIGSGVIPIVNENDVVAITELLFTDNDELAGLVASQVKADAVVILTSVEGFLTGDPKDPSAKLIPEVDFRTMDTLHTHISPDKTAVGRGGMQTKFAIAKKLATRGITVHFANGKRRDVLTDILRGERIGTRFLPLREKSMQ